MRRKPAVYSGQAVQEADDAFFLLEWNVDNPSSDNSSSPAPAERALFRE